MIWGNFSNSNFVRDPFFATYVHALKRLQDDFDVGYSSDANQPLLNAEKVGDTVYVSAEVPGLSSSDLDISVTGNVLTIKGTRKSVQLAESESFHRRERGYGEFARTLKLPFAVDAAHVEAEYKAGILTITLPRAASEKPRKIEIR